MIYQPKHQNHNRNHQYFRGCQLEIKSNQSPKKCNSHKELMIIINKRFPSSSNLARASTTRRGRQKQLCSTQHSDYPTLFGKYQLLPSNQKIRQPWNWKNLNKNDKQIQTARNVRYKRLKNTVRSEYSDKIKSQAHILRKQSSSCTSIKYSQINQIQRRLQETSNQTKITHESNSTKTASQAFNYACKQINEPTPSKQIQKSYIFMNKQNQNVKSVVKQIYQNVIPEQYESSGLASQSKTNRNRSNSSRGSSSRRSSRLKGSIFLPVNSVRHSKYTQRLSSKIDELEAGYGIIEDYMEFLNILANYSQEITQHYQNTQDWEQLIFLVYKKYYLHRVKFLNALFYRNVYYFQDNKQKLSSSKKKSLKKFMNSEDGQILKKQIIKQNIKISDSLRNIYNLAIQKSGNYINLGEVDNFSCQIYRLTCEQIIQLKNNFDKSPDLVKSRLRSILNCLRAIANLDKKIEQEHELNNFLRKPINAGIFQKITEFIKLRLI